MNYNQTYLAKEDLQMKLEGKVGSLELNKIISAYEMADNAYNDMQLPDGTPHFFHCTRVCNIIISELELFDPDLICAALLHKIYAAEVEISREIIDLNFGPYVAFLVEALKDEYKFSENPSWDLIKIGMDTNANLFIAPIQDLLSLDDSSRLNKPGTTKNNWKWKLNRPLEEIEDNIRIFSELGNNFGRTRK